jgi:hypothetical protein
MTDARRDPVLLAVKRKMGFAGLGMYWALVEAVAEQYKGDGIPELETDLSSWRDLTGIPPQSLRILVAILNETHEKLGKTLDFSGSLLGKTLKIQFKKIKDIRDNHTRHLQAACKQEEEVEGEGDKKGSPLRSEPPPAPADAEPGTPPAPDKSDQDREALRQAWSEVPDSLREVVAKVMKAIATTRASGKVADSRKTAILGKLLEYDEAKLRLGIERYLDGGYHLDKKDERYLYGIIRNIRPEELEQGLALHGSGLPSAATGRGHPPMPRTYGQAKDFEGRVENERLAYLEEKLNARRGTGQAAPGKDQPAVTPGVQVLDVAGG